MIIPVPSFKSSVAVVSKMLSPLFFILEIPTTHFVTFSNVSVFSSEFAASRMAVLSLTFGVWSFSTFIFKYILYKKSVLTDAIIISKTVHIIYLNLLSFFSYLYIYFLL